MHALLAQQLQVLESPQFIWRGEVWPGQELEWQLRRESEGSGNGAPPAEADAAGGWDSQMRLTLPTLGTVTVHLRMDAHQAFNIRVVPEDAALEPLLQQNGSKLAERLTAAGCLLQTLTVQHESRA
jgi:hypothetical protein